MRKTRAGSWARAGLAAAVLLMATGLAVPRAHALPPDYRLVLAPDTVKFIQPTFVLTGVAAEPEGFVQVEILPGREILITVPADAKPKSSGTVIAFGSDKVMAWEVCIGGCPAETSLASAKTACPGLAETKEEGTPVWAATIKDEKCLDALRQSLEHATVRVDSLRLTLDEAPANVFFKRVLNAIAADPKTKGIKAGYYGPTLSLSGETTTEGLSRALIHAYRHTVGRVSYDDGALTLTDRPATETQK